MTTPFHILQDDWIQIAPLGEHPHQLGIQRVDATPVAAMANRFNSFAARLGRLFSGVSLFEGHHDTEPDRYPNGKSFAWVMELQDRGADGLWGRVKWTKEGRDLVANGHYKFISPVWDAVQIGRENGRTVFRPENLLSLALTNLPNLPLPPLANEQNHMKTITDLLELPTEANPDAICEAVTRLKTQVTTLSNESENLRKSVSSADENSRLLANAIQRAGELQSRLITMILANAIRENRITLAQQDHWKTELEKDLAAAEAKLAEQQPALNTTSVTRELGNEKGAYDTEATRRSALTAFIAEQQSKGLSYDEAWAKAKTERADIFANMAKRSGSVGIAPI